MNVFCQNSYTVCLHDSNYADNYALSDNGNSWRGPVLQSVWVNSIRLPCTNQTPIQAYVPNGNRWNKWTCTTFVCWNTTSINNNVIL